MADEIIITPLATATAEGLTPTIIPTHIVTTTPTATATAETKVPVVIPINVTGVSVFPTTATIDVDELLIVNETVTPSNATYPTVTWSSDDPAVATVTDGIVRGISNGTATITATSDDPAVNISADCTVTVEAASPLVFTAVEVINKNMVDVEHEILNTDIVELIIEKELGGNQGLFITLPFTSAAVAEITPGRYLKCEDQLYYLESINTIRGSDGIPLLDVKATHIFFEIEKRQAGTAFAGSSTILALLQGLLSPFGIVVTGVDPDNHLYSTVRYVSYEAHDTVMECLKLIFQPYFATFRVDNLKLVVIPDVGELTTADGDIHFMHPTFPIAMAGSEILRFRYSVNNEAIRRETDYSDIVTKLYAEGEDISYTVDAPAAIKALYRQEREETVNFRSVSIQADLEYLANRYLAYKQLPHVNYILSAAELRHIFTDYFDIYVGRRIVVYDEEFGLDIESVIQRYTYRPLEQDRASQVVIGDLKPYDITFTEPDKSGLVRTPKYISMSLSQWLDAWMAEGESSECIGLRGIISTEDPDDEKGAENCLWIKY